MNDVVFGGFCVTNFDDGMDDFEAQLNLDF